MESEGGGINDELRMINYELVGDGLGWCGDVYAGGGERVGIPARRDRAPTGTDNCVCGRNNPPIFYRGFLVGVS